jgi:3-oxoacyl-[acyl-carrier protein] reductase
MSLGRAGVELTITARTAETLERTAEEIRKETGAKVTAVPGDISTEAGRAAALAACPNPVSGSSLTTSHMGWITNS